MVVYDLNKDKIPGIVEQLLEITSASEIDQGEVARDFVKELTSKHRTSQQLLIKLLSKIVKNYSETRYDPRNQASVLWAKKVSEIDNNFPYI